MERKPASSSWTFSQEIQLRVSLPVTLSTQPLLRTSEVQPQQGVQWQCSKGRSDLLPQTITEPRSRVSLRQVHGAGQLGGQTNRSGTVERRVSNYSTCWETHQERLGTGDNGRGVQQRGLGEPEESAGGEEAAGGLTAPEASGRLLGQLHRRSDACRQLLLGCGQLG